MSCFYSDLEDRPDTADVYMALKTNGLCIPFVLDELQKPGFLHSILNILTIICFRTCSFTLYNGY